MLSKPRNSLAERKMDSSSREVGSLKRKKSLVSTTPQPQKASCFQRKHMPIKFLYSLSKYELSVSLLCNQKSLTVVILKELFL